MATGEALHTAAACDDLDGALALMAAGQSPYETDEHGRTAFNAAASNGPRVLAAMVQAAFADCLRPPGERRYVGPGTGLNTPSGMYGSTLLTYAAKVCDTHTVRAMLDAGAELDIVNGSGWTLLHCAAVMVEPGRLEVVTLLCARMRAAGLDGLLGARSTHEYCTTYVRPEGPSSVVYGEGLLASELCRALIRQDAHCPAHQSAVADFLASQGA